MIPTTPVATGTAAATAAAEQQRRLHHEEEEELTQYTRDELREGWEFKILRANTSIFRKPEMLAKACEEEARAGWQLVEKFDNQRLRFKRSTSVRADDANLPPDVDPYRTHFGISDGMFVLEILGIVLVAIAVVAVAMILITR